MNSSLTQEELRRYSRHLALPEVGTEGQLKLKSARVLIIGAGGLGSPVALYLAAAGVGSIGIVDFDVVDITNLQRQILYTTDNVGARKTDLAREHVLTLNPNINVKTYHTQLTSDNAKEIIGEYDIIVDGTDNFPTRYLVNDACVLLGKINVYGSIFRFDGQVTVFDAKTGPCYRCLYPTPPPPNLVPNCAEGGVIGALPGIIGTIQALEVIKIIVGIGDSLVGNLLLFDGLKMEFQKYKLKKSPDCPICGENRTIYQLINYQEFCGIKPVQPSDIYDIMPKELELLFDSKKEIFLLDVREQHEYDYCNIGGILIPLGSLATRLKEIPQDKEIVVMCHHGMRSDYGANILRSNGFKNVKNLTGGIEAWSVTVDAKIPRY